MRVDLTRAYSNHQDLTNRLVTAMKRLRRAFRENPAGSTSVRSAPNAAQPRRVIERLGKARVRDLLCDIERGIARIRVAEKYGISESSVKRLVRSREMNDAASDSRSQ